ncbi:MAG: nucleotide exchange factor GrpE [Brachymonas sp.]|nr:nucleotide exchange factor GrpE [Brachymonas sp.]
MTQDTENIPVDPINPAADTASADNAAQTPDLEALQTQIQQLKDDYLRAQAEVQNTRRRAEEDVAKARKFGIEGFANSLLPVLDSFEAGLAVENATAAQLREGSEATLRQLLSALERNKVVPISPAQGDKFDPHLHQAISVAPAPDGVELAANSVVTVLQKGYLIADRVLRPALVMVTAAQ